MTSILITVSWFPVENRQWWRCPNDIFGVPKNRFYALWSVSVVCYAMIGPTSQYLLVPMACGLEFLSFHIIIFSMFVFSPSTPTIHFVSPYFQFMVDPFTGQSVVVSVIPGSWIGLHHERTDRQEIPQGTLSNEVILCRLGSSCFPSIDFHDNI